MSRLAWSHVKSLNVAELIAEEHPAKHKKILVAVLKRASPYLQCVTFLKSNVSLERFELEEVLRLSPNLRSLTLTGSVLSEDSTLALSVADKLQQLRLHSCYSFPGKNKNPEVGTLTEAYMTLAFAQLSHIKLLDLSRCDITGICLIPLSSTLSSISLGGTGRMTLDTSLLQRFLQSHPNLTEFRINYTKGNFTHNLPQLLSHYCPSLTILELSDLENCEFAAISGLTSLQQLYINQRWTHLGAEQQQYGSLSDSALLQICQSCGRLESLSIRGYDLHRNLTGIGLSAISNLTQLNNLTLTDSRVINDEILLDISQHLTSLRHVNLSNCAGITDKSIALISSYCPSLSLVKLNGCVNVTTYGINALITSAVRNGSFSSLNIFVSDTRVDPDGLVDVRNVTVETSQ